MNVTDQHVRLIAIAGVIVLEIVNILVTKYDGTMLNAVLIALLGLAGYDIVKKKKEEEKKEEESK
jgi:uncharacterized membrane protein YdbT with pleckstrin-like domain